MDTHDAVTLRPLSSSPVHRLGEWAATAICGNDITSSCLYVAALATIYAGKYAPLCLLLFIGSPSGRFPYRIAELGGVRLII